MRAISRLPRRVSYALLGAVLALGAPVGLCLLRAVRAGVLSAPWLQAEIAADALTYLYVWTSTQIAFSLFGLSLGRQADRLLEMSNADPLTGLQNARVLR